MTMTYTTFVQRLWMKLELMQSDVTLQIPLPEIIDYAENRIYRDLNLIATVTRAGGIGIQLTPSVRTFTLPTNFGTFRTVSQINVITPVGVAPVNGTRNPLIKMALGLLDYMVPTETTATGLPTMWAMVSDQIIVVGPSPDLAYGMEVIGSTRQDPLSALVPTNWLVENLPDLYLTAAMISATQYIPARKAEAAVWEAEYQRQLASANAEEVRRRYNLAVNTPMNAAPVTAGIKAPGPMGATVT